MGQVAMIAAPIAVGTVAGVVTMNPAVGFAAGSATAGLMQGVSAMQAADAEKKQLKVAARQEELAAKQEQASIMQQTNSVIASQRALLASRGIDPDSQQTPQQLQAELIKNERAPVAAVQANLANRQEQIRLLRKEATRAGQYGLLSGIMQGINTGVTTGLALHDIGTVPGSTTTTRNKPYPVYRKGPKGPGGLLGHV